VSWLRGVSWIQTFRLCRGRKIAVTLEFAAVKRIARNRGFTFIELLMVLAIISILVAIAMPAYRDYELRAEVAESLTLLSDCKVQVNDFYARWGGMPNDNADAGLRAADSLHGKYVQSVTVSGGVLVASMKIGSDLGGASFERTVTFRPWINASNTGAPIVWSCGDRDPQLPADYHVVGAIAANAVEPRWLPTVCRK
jgi:type IV pilus assembly protein PilA